jgi:hypothetical protein
VAESPEPSRVGVQGRGGAEDIDSGKGRRGRGAEVVRTTEELGSMGGRRGWVGDEAAGETSLVFWFYCM